MNRATAQAMLDRALKMQANLRRLDEQFRSYEKVFAEVKLAAERCAIQLDYNTSDPAQINLLHKLRYGGKA